VTDPTAAESEHVRQPAADTGRPGSASAVERLPTWDNRSTTGSPAGRPAAFSQRHGPRQVPGPRRRPGPDSGPPSVTGRCSVSSAPAGRGGTRGRRARPPSSSTAWPPPSRQRPSRGCDARPRGAARTQRWRERCPRWRPADEGGFDPDRYGVAELAEPAAAAFDRRHHYAATLPATTHRYGVLGFGRGIRPHLRVDFGPTC